MVTGELMHKNAHDSSLTENRKDVLITRALPVSSRTMGVGEECDVVEFHRGEDGVHPHGHRGLYSTFPVEYKKRKPKTSEGDILQLAAQIICLKEMFSAVISEAAVFYSETHRRGIIGMTDDLRNRVRDMFKEMHRYHERYYTPKAKWSKNCSGCSLRDTCLPKSGRTMPVGEHIKLVLEEEG